MAIEDTFEKLRTLQDILSEKIRLEQEIQEIPRLLVTQEELLTRLKKSFIEKNDEYEKAKQSQAEFKNLLAEAETARESSEKNMDVISTQREYEALDKEIKDASEKEAQYRKDLHREEKLLNELDEQMKQSASLIEQQELDLAERQKGIEAEIAEKNKQVAVLQEREKDITPGLDQEVLFKFERIIRNKMGRGIVAIKGGVCMGCHMILPAQFANTIREGEEIVFCPYCSRILFYEESDQEDHDYFDDDDAGSLADLDDMDDEEDEDDEEEDERVTMDYDD
ncbi:MAG: C4-type zinc ribbon domain-containing protein [Treponema sp.]|jgi:predicted  nucleic acid-binding Zn-ribbon protein|nr:C4-type zinc ribbon domain-containing protein [Treponema sp.]